VLNLLLGHENVAVNKARRELELRGWRGGGLTDPANTGPAVKRRFVMTGRAYSGTDLGAAVRGEVQRQLADLIGVLSALREGVQQQLDHLERVVLRSAMQR
jgi:hypothetical protein